MYTNKSNIILIGMAGCGKSSVGRLIARKLGRLFVDTDDLIVKSQGRTLQDIIDTEGPMGFRRIEEEVLLGVDLHDHVIATGGSSIYSTAGMVHLERIGIIVLLDAPLEVLKERVGDTSGRGLVKQPDQSFEELFLERKPLYDKYGSIRIKCSELDHDEVCQKIIEALQIKED